jgi:hypothetical protein
MAEVLVPAYVAHSVPGRLRLRIPTKRGDAAYFADLHARLSNRQEVADVAVNAGTGSVLVRLNAGFALADLAGGAQALSLFEVQSTPTAPAKAVRRQSALMTAAGGFRTVDRFVAEATGGYLDLKSSVFLVLVAMGLRQVVRGHFMVPGFTFLWHALNMMLE